MKCFKTINNLTHFVINDYPLKVTNAWAEELFDIPNTKGCFKSSSSSIDIKPLEELITQLMNC